MKITVPPRKRMLLRIPTRIFATALLLFSFNHAARAVPWLHVEGNQLKDASGNNLTLRGFSLLPSQHNDECTTCASKTITEVINMATDKTQGWHPNVLRIGVTNKNSALSNPATLVSTHLDPYVQQAISKGVYVIVDLHLVQDYDHDFNGTGFPQQKVLDFWNYVAPLYANSPNVIFEVYNEPINPDSWASWKAYIQPVVDAIRAVAPNNIILMGGPQWSTRVNQAAADPIAGGNIVYVYHLYPNQGSASTTNLDAKFGTAANTIPVIVSEFGWNQNASYSNSVTYGTTGGWGQPFRNYMDARPHINWSGYIFDNYWKPQYFDWSWNLMSGENQGAFMRNWLFDVQGSSGATQTPFTTQNIPGRIEAENFDDGGQNVSYHDSTFGNSGNAYRTTDVDIGTTTDSGGGYTVGYITKNEWLEYTIANVASGNYDIQVRVATAETTTGKSVTVKLDGVTLGTVTPTNTGGWDTYQTLTLSNVSIASGTNKVLRLEFGGGGFNLNYVEFVSLGTSTIYEAESTSRWASGATYATFSDAAANNGAAVKFNADGVGDFIEYTISHSGTVTYDVYLRFRAGPDQGTCQMYVNGSASGAVFDLYSPTVEYKEVKVSTRTLYTGAQKLRFTVAGKNASSTGYGLTQDYIRLFKP